MNQIKNVIFDLGGVLLNIDYQKTIDAFRDLGIDDFQNMFSQANQNNLFDDLETGKISENEFLLNIKNYLPENTSDSQIIDAWNAMLLDFPEERLQLLNKVNKHYKVYLLSNTNIIHLKSYKNSLDQSFGYITFSNCFKKVWLSHEVKMRKPHPETFIKLLESENLSPSETFFIDDSVQHVEGAIKAGLKAYWLNLKEENNKTILDLFDEKGKINYSIIS